MSSIKRFQSATSMRLPEQWEDVSHESCTTLRFVTWSQNIVLHSNWNENQKMSIIVTSLFDIWYDHLAHGGSQQRGV